MNQSQGYSYTVHSSAWPGRTHTHTKYKHADTAIITNTGCLEVIVMIMTVTHGNKTQNEECVCVCLCSDYHCMNVTQVDHAHLVPQVHLETFHWLVLEF